jgi:hypothetical protein
MIGANVDPHVQDRPLSGLPGALFDLAPPLPFAPAARRELAVFGAPAELVWLPERQARAGIPVPQRPPFRAPIVERILREEALWRGDGLVLTPNRYPFARRQLVLWSAEPQREPELPLIEALIELEARTGGTALLNTVGAAASIPRAHGHLVDERLPFLGALPAVPLDADWLPHASDAQFVALAAPFPSTAIGVRGDPAARARAVHALAQQRTTPCFNVVSTAGTAWLFPRQGPELPLPHFPHALGSSELWGRWCYGHEQQFRAATAADLERALAITGFPRHL